MSLVEQSFKSRYTKLPVLVGESPMQGRELRKLYFKHTMAKNSKVGILLEFNYEEPEFLYPYYRFKEAGFETVSIGPSTDTVYKGKHGYPFKAEVSIQDIKPEELAALIIPGGFAPDYWRRDKRFLDLIRQMNDLGMYVQILADI
ncbi:hypothetical protein C0Q70_06847 [Pomacea canaliculata]|uniref:DJ-1/PfpI domain-containing protein n=1 Tax=Pomacea canaliculata TaxID=400727 RepID=A0A2T7PDE0_POMCA|nr:hypothetical protein C0Q70_06847 [Pomacea canaliculata]